MTRQSLDDRLDRGQSGRLLMGLQHHPSRFLPVGTQSLPS